MKRNNNNFLLVLFFITTLFFAPNCGGKDKSENKSVELKVKKGTSSLVFKSGDYSANSDSSSILWECGWLGGRSHNGDVAIKEGSVNIKNGRIVSAGFVVNMNTIQCFDLKNGGKRNNLISHLKSDDFFDVENHQEARLMITSSKDLGGNNFLFNNKFLISPLFPKV